MNKRIILSMVGVAAVGGLVWGGASIYAAPHSTDDYVADKGPSTVDVASFPSEVQDAYKVFAAKCSKCHTLARPINTRKSAQEWKLYVKRMMNKPDSGISPASGKKIYKFLKYYEAAKGGK